MIDWNTVYIAAALDDLRADGERISDDELARLTPTLFGISGASHRLVVEVIVGGR
jgi:Tn3 transposase DDE domain